MLKVNNVSKSFGTINALSSITFEIKDGEFVFITGQSGAGKTTLIRLLLREFLPDTGDIQLDNEDLTKIPPNKVYKLRQKIGVVFQDFKVLPERTVFENIEIALAVSGVPQSEWKMRVENVLELVGLSDRGELFPSQLSGGELQRVSLARALVINPKIILADEPTGNLDWETADSIMQLFERINKEGKTILMATHHQGIIDKYKKRIITLEKGKVKKEDDQKVDTKEDKPEVPVKPKKEKVK